MREKREVVGMFQSGGQGWEFQDFSGASLEVLTGSFQRVTGRYQRRSMEFAEDFKEIQ